MQREKKDDQDVLQSSCLKLNMSNTVHNNVEYATVSLTYSRSTNVRSSTKVGCVLSVSVTAHAEVIVCTLV